MDEDELDLYAGSDKTEDTLPEGLDFGDSPEVDNDADLDAPAGQSAGDAADAAGDADRPAGDRVDEAGTATTALNLKRLNRTRLTRNQKRLLRKTSR